MKDLITYTINYQGVKKETGEKKSILIKTLTAAAAVILLSILLISLFSLIGSGVNSSNFIKHEIESGESLWSIAAHYYDKDNFDLRKIIYNIKQVNDIDSAVITPGRELIIPIK